MSVAGVAHLVERHLAKVEVAGSSPVTRSRKKNPLLLAKGSFFNEINPCGICEMPFGREILICNVKCLRAWVDLLHFTFRVSALDNITI